MDKLKINIGKTFEENGVKLYKNLEFIIKKIKRR